MNALHHRRLLPFAIGVALTLSSAGLLAQPQIEEIMVTAQKREQSLQDVPVAVSAFTGNFIAETRIGDIRVRFQYLIQKYARDGRVPLTVVRGGQPQSVQLPVGPSRPMLIPDLEGAYPSYFVYGPLVFSSATQLFLAGLNNIAIGLSGAGSPLSTRRSDRPAFDGEALVVVASPFFPHKLSKGYSQTQSSVVHKVNGTVIRNLPHLVATLRDLKDEFVVFEFAGRRFETPVFPRKEMEAATEDILNDNGVRAQGSPDVLKVWNQRAP
jgi:hypothetical protein